MKLYTFLVGLFLCQLSFSQVSTTDTLVTSVPVKTEAELKAQQEKLKAEQKAQKAKEKALKSEEKARRAKEKAQKKYEENVKKNTIKTHWFITKK